MNHRANSKNLATIFRTRMPFMKRAEIMLSLFDEGIKATNDRFGTGPSQGEGAEAERELENIVSTVTSTSIGQMRSIAAIDIEGQTPGSSEASSSASLEKLSELEDAVVKSFNSWNSLCGDSGFQASSTTIQAAVLMHLKAAMYPMVLAVLMEYASLAVQGVDARAKRKTKALEKELKEEQEKSAGLLKDRNAKNRKVEELQAKLASCEADLERLRAIRRDVDAGRN